MGAWIETLPYINYKQLLLSHPTWVRGLKLEEIVDVHARKMSHPTWVRGLKRDKLKENPKHLVSHPTWVRGLKLKTCKLPLKCVCRTLRGCVD